MDSRRGGTEYGGPPAILRALKMEENRDAVKKIIDKTPEA
jgi:hypothetical protein